MNIIHAIGADPRAWILVALFAARAIWSVATFARCATTAVELGPAIGPGVSKRMLSRRFVTLMVLGIALAVVGLIRLASGAAHPAFALFLLLLGVYLFTTEPVRRQIALSERRVREEAGGEHEAIAVNDLREAHVKLVAIEVLIVAVLLAGMLAL